MLWAFVSDYTVVRLDLVWEHNMRAAAPFFTTLKSLLCKKKLGLQAPQMFFGSMLQGNCLG